MANTPVDGLANNNDLRKRIIFTISMMAVFRLGVHIPTPGVDGSTVLKFFSNQGGVFGLFNTFTGGALNQFSVFALGIMPYISSSIIFQLLTAVVPYFEELKKEGQMGQKKITQWTRYGTIALALVQGAAISSWLMREGYEGHPLVTSAYVGFVPFQVMTVLTLTAGSCFVMWLGEQITDRGIGNGSSLIIFAGIAAGIPRGATSMYTLIKNGEMSAIIGLGLLVLMVAVIAAIVFLEVGQRRIPIQFSNKGGRVPGVAQASHLPLKINLSGVMPPIFASSLLLFPATLTQFVKAPWLTQIKDSLSPTGGIYTILFIALLVFFTFFYTEIVMNPVEVADNLKKGGKFIPGIRAGVSTSQYIQKVMDRLNVGGAIYLSAICVLPGQLIDKFNVPFYFGGTSLLILVGVALDTTQQLQSHLLTQKYDAFMKGARIRSRRVTY